MRRTTTCYVFLNETYRDYDAVVKEYRLALASERSSIMVHLWYNLWHGDSIRVEKRLCEKGDSAYKNSFIGRIKWDNCPLIIRHTLSSTAGGKRRCDMF